MKRSRTLLILVLLITGSAVTSAQTAIELDKAVKSQKAVFLVAYNTTGAGLDNVVAIANAAKQKMASTTMVVKMNTNDAANSTLVTKFRLAGAPLPLILVLDKNGITAGGLLSTEATAEKLVAMVPSPKTSEILIALSNGKSAYIVVYKESMTSRKSIMDNCMVACTKMENKSVVIAVNAEDKKEVKLLQTLKHNAAATEPVTYVVNTSGQVAGTYSGLTDINTLVSTAKKAPAGGCCPGGTKAGVCK